MSEGAKVAIGIVVAALVLADGVYNPFRGEDRQRQGEAPSRPASVQPQAPPTAGWAPTVAGVETGHERQTATPYTPPTYGNWNPDPFGSNSNHK